MNNVKTWTILTGLGLVSYLGGPDSARADLSALWECKGVTVDQSGPSTISVGGRLIYEIRIQNAGNCDLDQSSITDFIPRMSSFDQASPEPSEFPTAHPFPTPNAPSAMDMEHPVSKIEWKNVTLAAGKDLTFKVSAIVRGPEARVLLNTVCFENPRSGRICSQAETNVTK